MKMQTDDSAAGKRIPYCPTIPARSTTMPLRVTRILVAADSFPENSKKALQFAIRLAKKFGVSLELVYGITSTRDLKNAKSALLDADLAETEKIMALARSDDLIIISRQGRTGGRVAEQVVRHAPCPVVVVRSKSLTTEQVDFRFGLAA